MDNYTEPYAIQYLTDMHPVTLKDRVIESIKKLNGVIFSEQPNEYFPEILFTVPEVSMINIINHMNTEKLPMYVLEVVVMNDNNEQVMYSNKTLEKLAERTEDNTWQYGIWLEVTWKIRQEVNKALGIVEPELD